MSYKVHSRLTKRALTEVYLSDMYLISMFIRHIIVFNQTTNALSVIYMITAVECL